MAHYHTHSGGLYLHPPCLAIIARPTLAITAHLPALATTTSPTLPSRKSNEPITIWNCEVDVLGPLLAMDRMPSAS